MNHSSSPAPATPCPRRVHRLKAGLAAGGLVALALTAGSMATAAEPALDLQTAEDFSVLAGSGISNTGVTTLSGSIGSYETPTITTDTPFTFTGAGAGNQAGNGVTQQAKTDLLATYDDAAAATPPTAVPQELSRIETYLPGIYRASSSLLLSGSMTLDGNGRNDGVWVFQAPTSTLTTASDATVLFVNGAQPCNVYWQVGSSATFGTGTTFGGNVLADTSITAGTNATFQGRLLANNGAVTLDSNTFTSPGCEAQAADDDGTDGTDTDTDTDGADSDTDGADVDADGTDVADADTDGTDADGTDTDTDGTDTDTDGTDTDTDGTDTDTDGTDTDTDGTDTDTEGAAGDADGATSGGDGAAGGTGDALPDTGGPPWAAILLGTVLLAAGGVVVRGRRVPGTHRA